MLKIRNLLVNAAISMNNILYSKLMCYNIMRCFFIVIIDNC